MEKNLQNFRTVFITAPKELADHEPADFHGKFLDVHFEIPNALDNCRSSISTMNFIQRADSMINKDTGSLSVFIINFPNQSAFDRFILFADAMYPDNLIEFIPNSTLSDINCLINSYLYTISDNPNAYNYDKETIQGIIIEWNTFINYKM